MTTKEKIIIRMEKHSANYPTGKMLCYTFEADSFEDGLRIAKERYNSAGLIGRIYVSGSDGSIEWITN